MKLLERRSAVLRITAVKCIELAFHGRADVLALHNLHLQPLKRVRKYLSAKYWNYTGK